MLIKVYPDIKWDFHFFLNLSNELSVKWQNLSPAKHKEMQSKAGKIGAEKRWKQTEVDFGVALEANWDKVAKDKYNSHVDATLKYEEKIKQFYSIFASLKEFSKGVTGETKGAVRKTKIRKTKIGSNLPLSIVMLPPNFCLGAEWQLARGKNKGKETLEVGTEIKFYFKAEPIIGIELTIDLLNLLIQAGVAVFTAGSGNAAAGEIYTIIKEWAGEDREQGITFIINFDLILKGVIKGESQFTFNTASDENKAQAKLASTISAEIKLDIELKAKVVILKVTAYAAGIAKASGVASVTFGHKINKNEKGELYYEPELVFDGVKADVLVKVEVGISSKKTWLNGHHDETIVDGTYNFWKDFDVIKKLENVSGYELTLRKNIIKIHSFNI